MCKDEKGRYRRRKLLICCGLGRKHLKAPVSQTCAANQPHRLKLVQGSESLNRTRSRSSSTRAPRRTGRPDMAHCQPVSRGLDYYDNEDRPKFTGLPPLLHPTWVAWL
eukprot:3316129-Rhodomonas_salina.1